LIAPLVLFVAAYLIKANALSVIFWVIGLLLELAFLPVALFMLARGGYRTRSNIVITLLAAIPPALVVLGVLTFFFGNVHL